QFCSYLYTYSLGYNESLTFGNPTLFTYTPVAHPEWCVLPIPDYNRKTDQNSFRLQFESGEGGVKHCEVCDYYYKKKHRCEKHTKRKEKKFKKPRTNKNKNKNNNNNNNNNNNEADVEVEFEIETESEKPTTKNKGNNKDNNKDNNNNEADEEIEIEIVTESES